MPKITIRAARVNAGLTQDQMAEQLGVSLTTLNAWEEAERASDRHICMQFVR